MSSRAAYGSDDVTTVQLLTFGPTVDPTLRVAYAFLVEATPIVLHNVRSDDRDTPMRDVSTLFPVVSIITRFVVAFINLLVTSTVRRSARRDAD